MWQPVALQFLCLAFLASTLAIEPRISEHGSKMRNAQAAYQLALTQSHVQLSGLLRQVTEDSAMWQNLKWDLKNSVQQALAGRLRHDELDEIYVVNSDDCALRAKASLETNQQGAAAAPCPRDYKKAGESFFWINVPERAPSMALALKARDGTSVVGVLHLDQNWLRTMPSLKPLVDELQLQVVSGNLERKLGVLSRDGVMPDKTYASALISNHWLSRILPEGVYGIKPTQLPVTWLALVIAAFLSGLSWWRYHRSSGTWRREQEHLKQWAEKLAQTPVGMPLPPADAKDANLNAWQIQTLRTVQTREHQMALLQQQINRAEESLKSQQDEFAAYEQQIGEVAELESLSIQMQRTTKPFLESLRSIRSRLEDGCDALVEGVGRQAQMLANITHEWQEGFATRGSRRFLRVLSETATANGSNELDEQLHVMHQLSQELVTQSVNISVHAQGTLQDVTRAIEYGEHWQSLTSHSDQQQPVCLSLVDAATEAQQMILSQDRSYQVQFYNVFDQAGSIDWPAAPKAIWVSALHHLYLSMIMSSRTSGRRLMSQIRTSHANRKTLFVVSWDDEITDMTPAKHSEAQHHWEMVGRILGRYSIQCLRLPSPRGPQPLALSWKTPAKEAEIPHNY